MSNNVVNAYRFAESCTDVEQEQLLTDDVRNAYLTSQGGAGMWLATADALGVGAKLKKFSGWVKAVGTPEGTLYCRVYNQTSPPSTSASLETSATTTYDVSTLSTSVYAEIEFEFDGTYTLQVGDFILLWYTQGSGSGYLSIQFQTTDVYDGTDSTAGWHHTSNYRQNNSYDATMKITYCE